MANMNQIFINSMDNKENFIEFAFIPKEDISGIGVKLNNEKWSDGAPVIKYFYRSPIYIDYTYLKDKEYKFIMDITNNTLYYYDTILKTWIMDENLYFNELHDDIYEENL